MNNRDRSEGGWFVDRVEVSHDKGWVSVTSWKGNSRELLSVGTSIEKDESWKKAF